VIASMNNHTGNGGPESVRMLERRVSNNKSNLNADQQMNYFLAWFQQWTELQKQDFVPILAEKMAAPGQVNGSLGGEDSFQSLTASNSSRRPSLFMCQVKLFNDYFYGWSDDQKNYLVLRLKDIDPVFFKLYEEHLQDPDKPKEKDYYEPGVLAHLVPTALDSIPPYDVDAAVRKTSSVASSTALAADVIAEVDDDDDDDDGDLKRPSRACDEELSPLSDELEQN
jgi:hypothetical protein